jgi:hypothetical protein
MAASQRPFDPYQAGAKVYRAYRAGGRAGGPTDNPAPNSFAIEPTVWLELLG